MSLLVRTDVARYSTLSSNPPTNNSTEGSADEPTKPTKPLSKSEFWDSVHDKDDDNAHMIVKRIMKRGGPITHHDVNEVLKKASISITEEELNELKNIKPEEYSFTDIAALKKKFNKNTR